MSDERHGAAVWLGRFVRVEPPRALVDFNDLHDDLLVVSLEDLTGMLPDAGDAIVLTDDDGNVCTGRVREVAEAYLLVKPIWETWATAPRQLILTAAGTEGRTSQGRTFPSAVNEAATTQAAGEAKTGIPK